MAACGVNNCTDTSTASAPVWVLAVDARMQVTTVDDIGYSEFCEMHASAFNVKRCQVLGCAKKSSYWFYLHVVYPPACPAIFGIPSWTKVQDGWLPEFPQSVIGWYPDGVTTCQQHWRSIRSKHGTELAFTMRNGQTIARVKEYWS